MVRLIITTALLLISSLVATASNANVKGKVTNGKNAIEFANVVIQTSDSAFVTGGVTDQRGRFDFSNIADGNYILKISCMGYQSRNVLINVAGITDKLEEIKLDTASIALDEVVVKGSCIVNQADKKIYLPTSYQIKSSTSGLDILMQMKLNRLTVNPVQHTISSSNEGEVQLRINGAKAEMAEIQAIKPDDIQRVEYHENPGLRYGSKVAVVIDYITKVKHSGGYLGIDTQNSPNIVFGNNGVNGKFNYKNSEFGINYWGMYRGLNGYWRDNYESFNFADGTSFIRQEDGTPGKLKENHHYITMNYSYRMDEKWSFVARLRGAFNDTGMDTHSFLYPVKQRDAGVTMRDNSSSKNNIPSLDLYFQRNYPHKQTLVLNAVGTYIHSNDSRYYTEDNASTRLTDITSLIEGDKYSFIGEAIYEKGFHSGTLSTGINWYQQYSHNQYSGTITTDNNLRATYVNFYAEWSGRVKKWDYRASVGGLQARYSQAANTQSKLLPTARVNTTYNFSDNLTLNWNANVNYSAPELGDISDVEQIIDSLQIRRGNPNLKECDYYSTRLMLDYHKGIFAANATLFYQYQHNPIMESVYQENNKFVRTNENQRSWQKINPEMEIKVGPLLGIFNISLTGGMNYFDSHGNNYRHNYTNWYYNMETSAMYKNLMLMITIQNHKNDFYGETISSGEAYHTLLLRYRHKNLTAGLMTLNPFASKDSYRRPTQNLNKYAPSNSCWYLRESSQLYVATLTWDFTFGRKYNSVNRRINREDNTTGAMKSGK